MLIIIIVSSLLGIQCSSMENKKNYQKYFENEVNLLQKAGKKPKLLLLDEHTAALDPRTAAKVLELSEKIISENQLMTLMVTHNMKDAIRYGNRLIMMNEGRIILDVSGEEKKQLTIEGLMEAFARASGESFVNDRMLLS